MKTEVVLNIIKRKELGNIYELFRLALRRRLSVISAYRPEVYHGTLSAGARLEFPATEKPLVTVIIPAHNNWAYTYSCLYSVLHNTDGIPYEVIVADDASDDETKNIKSRVSGIRLVRSNENLGFLRACNTAAREAAGRYILLLNNDTNVQCRWLNGLAGLLENDPGVGMVGSKLVYPDGRLQDAGGIIWNSGECWLYGRWDDPLRPEYNRVREADYVSGACMLIRRELWESIGGFDERYSPAYYEDTDLAMEVRKRGYKVMYQPDSVVVHFEGISCGRNAKKDVKRYQEINREKFFRKWETVLKAEYPGPGRIKPWREVLCM